MSDWLIMSMRSTHFDFDDRSLEGALAEIFKEETQVVFTILLIVYTEELITLIKLCTKYNCGLCDYILSCFKRKWREQRSKIMALALSS